MPDADPSPPTGPGEFAAEDEPGPRRMRLLFLAPLLVFAALAVVFMLRLQSGDPSRVPSVLIGRTVPGFSLPPLDGLRSGGAPVPGLTDADLRAGKVSVVNVWASWCAPCRQEHPLLTELAREPGLRLVGINYKDATENARRFLGALGNPYAAVGTDPNGRAAIDWGVYGVPETFIVDGGGIIRYKQIGPLDAEQMSRFREELAKAARPLPGH